MSVYTAIEMWNVALVMSSSDFSSLYQEELGIIKKEAQSISRITVSLSNAVG